MCCHYLIMWIVWYKVGTLEKVLVSSNFHLIGSHSNVGLFFTFFPIKKRCVETRKFCIINLTTQPPYPLTHPPTYLPTQTRLAKPPHPNPPPPPPPHNALHAFPLGERPEIDRIIIIIMFIRLEWLVDSAKIGRGCKICG